jgi:hypothetical protein
MVGNQGKHMVNLRKKRISEEKSLLERPILREPPKVGIDTYITKDEENSIRGIVKVWDTKLILKWLQLHPDVVERARIVFPNDEEGLKITSKIRCDTEVDISDRRFKRTLKELLIMEGKV